MPNYFNAKEILAERWWNRRGTAVPFTAGQLLGLPIDETLPDPEERKRRCLEHAASNQTETSNG